MIIAEQSCERTLTIFCSVAQDPIRENQFIKKPKSDEPQPYCAPIRYRLTLVEYCASFRLFIRNRI